MDGLGGITGGRHTSAMVVRFELHMEQNAIEHFSVQTKPSAVNRHFFWDEQISLSLPNFVMNLRNSSASIKISMIGTGPLDSDIVFAVVQKPLHDFIQHVVEEHHGFFHGKSERHDVVVPLVICGAFGLDGFNTTSASRGSNAVPVVRIRLGLMLFKKTLGSSDCADIVGRFENNSKTCKSLCLLSSTLNLI